MFTYKKHIATGRYAGFELEHIDIKIKRKVVGYIGEKREYTDDERYKIYFAINKPVTDSDPAPFKWVIVKRGFKTVEDTKNYLKENFEKITSGLDLHYFED